MVPDLPHTEEEPGERSWDDPAFEQRHAVLARGYGMQAHQVRRTAEFEPAFAAALAHDGPALIHLCLDDRDISPFAAEAKV